MTGAPEALAVIATRGEGDLAVDEATGGGADGGARGLPPHRLTEQGVEGGP
jgi:hypothetical protein